MFNNTDTKLNADLRKKTTLYDVIVFNDINIQSCMVILMVLLVLLITILSIIRV